ncbi:UNVERIFIED_CONTAM: hypothetical protein Slati_2655900, partial [Sesamum latifolium]
IRATVRRHPEREQETNVQSKGLECWSIEKLFLRRVSWGIGHTSKKFQSETVLFE